MIELLDDTLTFRFPGIHKEAECSIDFQRTLRIPDDNREYPLPPGLGEFPVQHVDDFAAHLPEAWERHGGVLIFQGTIPVRSKLLRARSMRYPETPGVRAFRVIHRITW